jgi:hypothetical protein
MKRKKLLLLFLVGFILLSNIPVISWGIGLLTHTDTFMGRNDYYYISEQGGFVTRMDSDFEGVRKKFESYKKQNPNDTTLCRCFKINYLYFWKWRAYLFEDMYQPNYKSRLP